MSDSTPNGYTSKQSPAFSELKARDSLPLSVAMQAEGNYQPVLKEIPFDVHFDPDYAQQEMAAMWKKCWQFVCREEDIPNVGDRYTYDVGDMSFVVIRSTRDGFRALQNSCLHRGTRLCEGSATGDEIKCPFHGWRWNVDGSLKRIPGKWDFPEVDGAYALPQARLDTWGGCIFVNPDPDAEPLADALGILPEHFAHFKLAQRFTLVKTAKRIRANWKTVWSAFLEAYHVEETHFDAMPFTGDGNTQYDCFRSGDSIISRLITPQAVPSPYLGERVSGREAAVNMLRSLASAVDPGAGVELPDTDAPDFGRAEVAAWWRTNLGNMLGADLATVSDCEMIDSIQYAMFPNFGPWLGEGLPLMYQFLPLGNDPNESMFVVRLLAPLPANNDRPPAAPMTFLDFDEPFESLPEWGRVAHVFDQDMDNLPRVQHGMRSSSAGFPNLTLAQYQEQRIALLHEFVERQIAKLGSKER
ncbi:MAG: aromatic ring-hydroxylating oxygenase subunit alpha [Pseudomonadales bacterium]